MSEIQRVRPADTFTHNLGALIFGNIPELSQPSLGYMARSYDALLAWSQGEGPAPFDHGDIPDPFDPNKFNVEELQSDQTQANAALGAVFVLDISMTSFGVGNRVLDEVERQRRSLLGEILTKGTLYGKFARFRGEGPLAGPEEDHYSPKLVAYVAAYGVKDAIKTTGHGNYKDFRKSLLLAQ